MIRSLLIVGFGMGICVNAQNVNLDSIPENPSQQLQNSLDSLVHLWYVNGASTSLVPDTIIVNEEMVKSSLPDSVYIQRLADIESPINYSYNSKVKSYIELYTIKRRNQVQSMIGLSDYYFPMFEEALDARNMPIELKYLPVIESALNPRAFSKAGAAGLWQFMYYTGKQYGLTVNSYIDERRDPYKSTMAAVSFLEDLYRIYDDWLLVIAAYNCGPGNVNKAIRRSGGHRDFWKIYYHLPRETRGYVPAFIAATYTFTYAHDHFLYASPSTLPKATDTIKISKALHFTQISEMLGVKVEYLRDLNPQYRKDVIPANKKTQLLRLEFNYAAEFAAQEDTIYAHKREKYFTNGNEIVAKPEYNYHTPDVPKGKKAVYYNVKSGDAVGLIADWYDVRTSDLRYWNNISRNLIRVGQKLVVYVPQGKVDYYAKINGMSYSEKQKVAGKIVTISKVKNSTPTPEDSNYVYYTVRDGDNLWTIAQKYEGVSNNDIMNLNNISNGRKISIGQRLKIKPKS